MPSGCSPTQRRVLRAVPSIPRSGPVAPDLSRVERLRFERTGIATGRGPDPAQHVRVAAVVAGMLLF